MRIQENTSAGPLARYQDAQGHVFSLTAADAERLGYTAVDAPAAEQKAVGAAPSNKAVKPAANKAGG